MLLLARVRAGLPATIPAAGNGSGSGPKCEREMVREREGGSWSKAVEEKGVEEGRRKEKKKKNKN